MHYLPTDPSITAMAQCKMRILELICELLIHYTNSVSDLGTKELLK